MDAACLNQCNQYFFTFYAWLYEESLLVIKNVTNEASLEAFLCGPNYQVYNKKSRYFCDKLCMMQVELEMFAWEFEKWIGTEALCKT